LDPFVSNTEHRGLVLVGGDFSDRQADSVAIKSSTFEKVRLARTALRKPEFEVVSFRGCDMANGDWEESILAKVEMDECRMTGIGMVHAALADCRFVSCEAKMANFRFSAMKKTNFVGCSLRNADFQRADLRGTVFEDCDLRGAQMSFAKLDGVVFCGSQIDDLQVGVDDLRGAIVDASQAAYLAGLMGLVIR
jgi:uncharacterized protein YjbI with pentapeptide repeats